MEKSRAEHSSFVPPAVKRTIYYRDAVDAGKRLRVSSIGRRYVIRFSLGQRIEHFVLIFSFTVLAITGLAQSYYNTLPGGFILSLFGGIDASRQVHHVASFFLGILALYHVAIFVDGAFVHGRFGKMLPAWSDVTDAIQTIKFSLGLASRRPHFDRYSFEEKVDYWALVLGTIIMGVTGIIQMFPAQLTLFLPAGWVIPVSRTLHFWQAILMVFAVLIWHSYHAVIKKKNLSIFNGNMTVEEMKEEHPLELAYLEQASAAIENKRWPLEIEIQLENVKETEAAIQIKDGSAEEIASKNHIEGSVE